MSNKNFLSGSAKKPYRYLIHIIFLFEIITLTNDGYIYNIIEFGYCTIPVI